MYLIRVWTYRGGGTEAGPHHAHLATHVLSLEKTVEYLRARRNPKYTLRHHFQIYKMVVGPADEALERELVLLALE